MTKQKGEAGDVEGMRMRLLRVWVVVTGALMMAGVGQAQQMVPHDWPDTVMTMGCGSVGHVYRFMDGSGALTDFEAARCAGLIAAPLTVNGTVAYQQAGYDSTTGSNGSVSFSPGAKAVASSPSANDLSFRRAGGYEVVMANLNAPSAGSNGTEYSVVGKSPGISSLYYEYAGGTQGWGLFLLKESGLTYLYAVFSGSAGSEAVGGGQTYCSVWWPTALTNGYTYDVTISWPGDTNCANVIATLNGVALTAPNVTISNQASFSGIYKTTLTSGGTGYLSGGSGTFAVTYSGGGCTTEPTGLATVTSGVVTSVTNSSAYLFGVGCSSAPMPVFSAGGGTGAAGTSTLNTADTTNSGYLTVGDFSSTAWTSGSSLNVAGFASYPNGLTAAEYEEHFAAMDWYRNVMPAKPSVAIPIFVTNDFCADVDGAQQLWVLQRLQQMGYVNILSVTDTEAASGGPQWVQMAMARAGMAQVPVTQTTISEGDAGYCTPALAVVSPETVIARAAYANPNTTLRQALVNAASNSVVIFDGGALTTVANLLGSAADGSSSLTGAQLLAAKAQAYYCQCGNGAASGTGSTNWGLDGTNTGLVLTNWPSTGLPMYANGLTPSVTNGPGSCNVYPTTSLPYNTWYNWGAGACAAGSDARTPWDVLPVLQWLMPGWFTNSASGTFTYNSSANTYTWSGSTASGEYYASAQAVNGVVLQSFIDSLEWSDAALHGVR